MSESHAEHGHELNGLSKLGKTKNGKIGLAAGGLVIAYLLYRHLASGSRGAVQSAPAGAGSVLGGSTGASSGSGGVAGAPVSAADQMTAWFSNAEKTSITTSPADAAMIDQTLADVQNGNPLSQAEQTQWQKILSGIGAPPMPIGLHSADTIPAVAGGVNPQSWGTVSAALATDPTILALEQELSLVSAQGVSGNPITANASTPPQQNVVSAPAAASYYHLPTLQGLTPGTALYAKDQNGNMYQIPGVAALQHLAPGTAIYTKQ